MDQKNYKNSLQSPKDLILNQNIQRRKTNYLSFQQQNPYQYQEKFENGQQQSYEIDQKQKFDENNTLQYLNDQKYQQSQQSGKHRYIYSNSEDSSRQEEEYQGKNKPLQKIVKKQRFISLTQPQKSNLIQNMKQKCDYCCYQNQKQRIQDDYYDLEYQSIVYFLLYKTYPICAVVNRNQKTTPILRRAIRQKSKYYYVQKCGRNQYHLISKKYGKIVPMLHRTCAILKQLHGSQHISGNQIRSKVRKLTQYDHRFIDKYTYMFVRKCPLCSQKFYEKLPGYKSYKEDIFLMIEVAKKNRLPLFSQDQHIDKKKISFDLQNCEYECTQDIYQQQFQQIIDYNLKGIEPARFRYLGLQYRSIEKRKLSERMKFLKIAKCQKGTLHLWKYKKRYKNFKLINKDDSFKEKYRRVPMKKQLYYIANKLHGIHHMRLTSMVQMLGYTLYSKKEIKQYLYSGQFECDFCKRFKQNSSNSKMKNNNSENDSDSQQLQRENFLQKNIRKQIKMQEQSENQGKVQETNNMIQFKKNCYLEYNEVGNNCKDKIKDILTTNTKTNQIQNNQFVQQYHHSIPQQSQSSQNYKRTNKFPKQQRHFKTKELKNRKVKNKLIKQKLGEQVNRFTNENFGIMDGSIRSKSIQQTINGFQNNPEISLTCFPNQQQCKIVLVISTEMYKNYHQFGDLVYFQEFTELLESEEEWHTYFLSGIDQEAANSLFGICVLADQSFQTYYYTFSLFFSSIETISYPKSIITSYSLLIKEALTSFCYYSENESARGLKHFFLWDSLIDSFVDRSEGEKKKQLSSSLLRAMKSRTQLAFIKELKQLKKYLPRKLCKEFIIVNQMVCYSMMPHIFIGQVNSQTRLKQYRETIYTKIPCQVSLEKFIKKSLILNSIFNKEKVQNQNYSKKIQNPELISLDSFLPNHISVKLQKNYSRAKSLIGVKTTFKNSRSLIAIDEKGEFKVSYELQNSCWRCSCGQLQFFGVPCYHLFIALGNRGSLLFYINSRWFTRTAYEQKKKIISEYL